MPLPLLVSAGIPLTSVSICLTISSFGFCLSIMAFLRSTFLAFSPQPLFCTELAVILSTFRHVIERKEFSLSLNTLFCYSGFFIKASFGCLFGHFQPFGHSILFHGPTGRGHLPP